MCSGPYDCPYANDVVCSNCGLEERVPDTNILECTECDSRVTVKRCSQCPLTKLDEVRAESDAGRILEVILELDNAATNYRVGWDEIEADHARYIAILKEERGKWELEKARNRQ